MELLVIPNIENGYSKERTKDELPQSATGKSIMTTEPKFVPNEAVEIKLETELALKVRMIDCVGYIVPSAMGHMDGVEPRMINTPWFEEKIPFVQAAETGTKKVITEHSTIGVMVTTDGTITDIPREDYIEAENRVISELKAINKPFVILLNSSKPYAPETEELRQELAGAHHVPVMTVNCMQLKLEDINNILEKILYEFPVRELKIYCPKWIEILGIDHWLKQSMIKAVKGILSGINKLGQLKENIAGIEDGEFVKKAYIDQVFLGHGSAKIEIAVMDDLFYRIISETTGMQINDEYQLISTIKVLAEAKKEHDKVKYALEDVRRKGYGIVTPVMEEMKLDEPIIIKHGSKFGVRFKASAPSIHLIRADIETEVSPIVGTEKQSEDLITYITNEMSEDPSKIWELNMFGKSMHDLVREGLQSKLFRMPEDAQMKLQDTLQKIINEGSGGLICIIL